MATSSNPATVLSTQENTPLITQESMSGASDKTWASGRDWEQHQTQITQLYQTKPLKEVVRIMESEFDFKATQRMFKTRIHQWGLDKNKKENEMRAVVRKQNQRERQGKPSAFRVRGRPVDLGEVVRYWERKGMTIEDVAAQRAMSATPDAVVECSTPVLSQPSTPEGFAIPESVIRSIQHYVQGSFESGTWHSEDPRLHCKSMKVDGDTHNYLATFYDQCFLACNLSRRSESHKVGRTLICATASIKKILQSEYPGTLGMLFSLVFRMAQRNRLEIAIAVLRKFADLGEVLVGVNHPLSRICAWLASLESSQFQDVLDVCMHSTSDQFDHLLGPMHRSTLSSRLNDAQTINSVQDTRQGESVTEKLLASCIQGLGSCDVRTLRCYLTVTYQYGRKGDFITAQGLARRIIHHSQNVEPPGEPPDLLADGLNLLAESQYGLGQTASAEVNLRQAMEVRMSIWGRTDAVAWIWLVKLESWMAEQGNLTYAAQLRDWRYQTLSQMEVEEQ